MKWRSLILSICLSLPIASITAQGGWYREIVGVNVDSKMVVDQHIHPTCRSVACGPSSVLTALGHAIEPFKTIRNKIPGKTVKDQLVYVIKTYGFKPSKVKGPKKHRFNPKSGIRPEDLLHLANDLLPPHVEKLNGTFITRNANESTSSNEYIQRIHGYLSHSLSQGVPPIISIKSYVVNYYPKRQRYLWDSLANHFVVVVSVPKVLAAHEFGFKFDYIDPVKGRLKSGYIHQEYLRNFLVQLPDANRKLKWITNFSQLVVHAPDLYTLRTMNQSWHARTNIVLNYGIGKFFPAKK